MTVVLHALRTDDAVPVTGSLQHPLWAQAPWSARFVDMATGEPALLDTSVAVLSTPLGMQVGFRVSEPFPAASVFDRDGIVFRDNDVEVFIDFGWGYYEFEINAAGTVYEVMHVWRDAFGSSPFAADADWNLLNPDVFTFAGDFDRKPESFWTGTHPRGVRVAHRGYDFPGLVSAVQIDGCLNDPSRRSVGWTADVLFPWPELERLSGGSLHSSAHGVDVSMFFGRFQHLNVGGQRVTAAWCVTPHGVADTHQPERFTTVRLP